MIAMSHLAWIGVASLVVLVLSAWGLTVRYVDHRRSKLAAAILRHPAGGTLPQRTPFDEMIQQSRADTDAAFADVEAHFSAEALDDEADLLALEAEFTDRGQNLRVRAIHREMTRREIWGRVR